MVEAEPSYLQFHPAAFLVGVAHERVVNRLERLADLRSNVFGRLARQAPSRRSQSLALAATAPLGGVGAFHPAAC